jgi:hypothetical protein
MGILDMDRTAYCHAGAREGCYATSESCACTCHDDDDRTYGGYATQDEYYAEWGE